MSYSETDDVFSVHLLQYTCILKGYR